ncbi:zinc-ribbon domain-containing protein [Spirillospora sp. NPDC029432]|uniref:zinc-ribbon domain-containing protein n=1 Tax=Spirillospora sp. NPDC029432 TaxID=3154599 RepID=UPI003452D6C9
MSQWLWELNEPLGLDPRRLRQGSDKKAYWRFPCGHVGAAIINARVRGHDCKLCAPTKVGLKRRIPRPGQSLAEKRPDLLAEWDYDLNEVDPSEVAAQSNLRRHWICPTGHRYDAGVNERHRGRGCPYCRGLRVGQGNDLATLRPDLAAEWDWDNNGTLTPSTVTTGSMKMISWICSNNPDHRWDATPANRRTRNCPYCANRRLHASNSLLAASPLLASEWHPNKNHPLTPDRVLNGGAQKVWWLCAACGHEWHAAISSRINGTGCWPCGKTKTRQKLRKPEAGHALADLAPDLAVEWHPTLNALTSFDVGPGSGLPAWWRCSRGHVWQAAPDTRTRIGSGCEKCQMGSTSALEIRIFAELEYVLSRCNFIAQHSIKPTGVARAIGAVDMLFADRDQTQSGIVVEFDGSWWHSTRDEADRHKVYVLEEAGYGVIRIRENPLPLLGPCDISVRKYASPHSITVKVLRKIVTLDWVDTRTSDAIDSYVANGLPVATERASKMIHDRGGYDLAVSAALLRKAVRSR